MAVQDKKLALDTAFYSQYRGTFSGILRWPQLDEFWQALRNKADAHWYIYTVGEPVPQRASTSTEVLNFISDIDARLRREHDERYCGLVYTDSKTDPGFIKIYDPNNLGVVCGFSDNPPLPGWILSLLRPEPLNENMFRPARKHWWQLFARD